MSNQISKIQLRRGPQIDLPGAPGLDVGELAFTTDTNRIFVGSDPSTSNIIALLHNAQQPAAGGFPFTNVEILTEFSPTNQVLFDAAARNIQTAFIISAPLALTGANTWAPLYIQSLPGLGASPIQIPFVIDAQSQTGAYGTAHISYHIVDFNTGAPMRSGKLTVFCQGNSLPPSIVDDASVNPFAGFLTGGLPVDPNMRYGMIAFQAVPTPTGISIQYQINITPPSAPALPPLPIMYFRVEQPVLGITEPSQPPSKTVTTTVFDVNGGVDRSVSLGSIDVIDCSVAKFFQKTITASTTFSIANIPTSGLVADIIVNITNGGAHSITWWTGIKWAAGTAPTLTASGVDVLRFYTFDGGVTWYGFVLGLNMG